MEGYLTLPKVKMDHRSLCRYAEAKNKQISDLTKEEYQFVDWFSDTEFKMWRNDKYSNWDAMSKFEQWVDERR